MTQRGNIRNNLNKSDWEITKDKCHPTRAHRRHLAANGKHENKRKLYCTNVHLRDIEILITLMYNLSAVTAAPGAGVPATRLSEAHLAASDVDALVREVHPCGGGFVGGGQVGVPKGRPALRGLQLRGAGVVPGRGVR